MEGVTVAQREASMPRRPRRRLRSLHSQGRSSSVSGPRRARREEARLCAELTGQSACGKRGREERELVGDMGFDGGAGGEFGGVAAARAGAAVSAFALPCLSLVFVVSTRNADN
eukprot:2549777-Pleurochrysis_carterae.AAC.1